MIPMMLQQGYKALAVTFDVWGVANMVNDGMNEARAIIEQSIDAAKENSHVEQAVNGSKVANGSADGAVEVVTERTHSS